MTVRGISGVTDEFCCSMSRGLYGFASHARDIVPAAARCRRICTCVQTRTSCSSVFHTRLRRPERELVFDGEEPRPLQLNEIEVS